MKRHLWAVLPLLCLAASGARAEEAPGPAVGAAGGQPAIKKVAIGPHRGLLVNGKPFFPIMGWLQDPGNLPTLKACGFNTITGYWWDNAKNQGAGGTKNAAEYAARARQAGLYFIPTYMPQHPAAMKQLAASDTVLAWIHNDEPDLPQTVSDAEVTPAKTMHLNNSTPLWKILDGDKTSWSVFDPMEGAEITIKLKQPVTVQSFNVYPTISAGLAVAKEVSFAGDGKELLKATLENKRGPQKLDLPAPATFTTLTFKVISTYPDKQVWGSISEIEGLDKDGKNVLLSPPRKLLRETPEQCMERYRAIKALDPMRPVLMTVTCFFINEKSFEHWWPHADADRIYPPLLKAADFPGFDVYPIYGWNRPEKLDWVSQGVRELRDYAGRDKPLYVWTETLAGNANWRPVTGVEIRNEVYQAIINGATGIGYFTHRFKPTFSEFGVPEENQKAILAINRQIERLAPVILDADAAPQAQIAIEGGLAGQCLTKMHAGERYVFAANVDMGRKGGKATITLEGLKAGAKIEVVDEGRTLTADAGRFTDDFAPLAVHIYRVGE